MSIKEATKELHTQLESMPFNKKMFKGEHTNEERSAYLACNYILFRFLDSCIEHPDLKRFESISLAIQSLGRNNIEIPCEFYDYQFYLENTCVDIRPHIYLNYMGFLYGGQFMKKRYPSSSHMYEFNDVDALRTHIREKVCEDTPEFIEEVKRGFEFWIDISKALGKMFNVV